MSQPECVQLLRDYVAIPSVNPMGRDDISDAISCERRYAEHLAEQLRRLGLDATLVGEGERISVVAEAGPRDAADCVLVASHLDTVPVDGMEIPPFEPCIDAGRLHGRGACDTKAGMAALVAALARVLPRGRLRRRLVLVGEADEELGSRGVQDVLAHLDGCGRRADWAIATEPTGLRLVTHHKGIALLRLEAHGRACHSSDPGAGRNALGALARAILALEELGRELALRPHPILGPGTLSVGLAGGGHGANIVPDRAWLVSDRRLLPGDDAESVRAEVEAALARAGVEDVQVTSCRVEKPALASGRDQACVRQCLALLADEGLPAEATQVAFGTDGGLLAERGIPSLVFGPGSIARAHTAREYVELEQLETATRWFERLLETPG